MLHNSNKIYRTLGVTLIVLTTMWNKTYTTEITQPNTLQDQTTHQIQENTTLDTQQTITLINKIVTKFGTVSDSLLKKIKTANIEQQNYSDEDVEKLIEETLNVASFQDSAETPDIANLKKIHTTLINSLKNYKVTGFSFAVDPNFAFFYNSQNPEFAITYMDQDGNEKTRTYQAEINSIGLKFALSVNFDFMFFVNTDADFYTTNKKIILGKGLSFNASAPLNIIGGLLYKLTTGKEFPNGFNKTNIEIQQTDAKLKQRAANARMTGNSQELQECIDFAAEYKKQTKRSTWGNVLRITNFFEITYVSFANMPGGMLIINIIPPFPIPVKGVFYPSTINDLSLVTGGSLTPIN